MTYSMALNALQERSDDIKQAFINRAGETETISIEKIHEILDELSVIIGISLRNAETSFFKIENDSDSSLKFETITYQVFIEKMKKWLQDKLSEDILHMPESSNIKLQTSSELPKINENGDTFRDGNRANGARKIKKTFQEKPQIHKRNSVSEDKAIPSSSISIQETSRSIVLPSRQKDYQANKEKLASLIAQHKDEYCEEFNLRKNSDLGKIAVIDYFVFLQECFHLDNVLLMEMETDEHDFFHSVNSYKRLMKIVESYFINIKREDSATFKVKEAYLTFEECFEVLEYWFQTDEHIILLGEDSQSENREKSSNEYQNTVKVALIETISHYKKILERSNSEVEKQVLNDTIDTLLEKVKELERGNSSIPKDEVSNNYIISRRVQKAEEKKMKALREIFDFYSKQKLGAFKVETFEKMEKHYHTVNITKFSAMLKDFRLKMDQYDLYIKELLF